MSEKEIDRIISEAIRLLREDPTLNLTKALEKTREIKKDLKPESKSSPKEKYL